MNEKSKVVLVEDDDDFLTIVRQWLLPSYDTVSLGGGGSLLNELPLIDPDLLILDVKLPDGDGFELCRKIRRNGRFPFLPILFLTACAGDDDFLKYLDCGGSAYLTKPVGRGLLLRRIKELLPA